jgi:hypothetical protein
MKRRHDQRYLSLHDRLVAWATELRKLASTLPPGPKRDALLKKARQADTEAGLPDLPPK